MKRLAIIPARGGSKRLPRKNMLNLAGKPLIQHTIEAVIKSRSFETIIFSSDDNEMLEFADEFDGIVSEKRDPSLAGDQVKVIKLIKTIAERIEFSSFDQVGLFLPTCPFRSHQDINEGLSLLTMEIYSVVSVCEMSESLQLSVGLDEKTKILKPESVFSPSPLVTGDTRSQDFDRYFRVNGGFYLAWLNQFNERDNFFQGVVKGHVMDRLKSIDIDNEIDLEIANLLVEQGIVSI